MSLSSRPYVTKYNVCIIDIIEVKAHACEIHLDRVEILMGKFEAKYVLFKKIALFHKNIDLLKKDKSFGNPHTLLAAYLEKGTKRVEEMVFSI